MGKDGMTSNTARAQFRIIAMTALAAMTLAACGGPASAPRTPGVNYAAANLPAPQVIEEASENQPVGSRMPNDPDLCRASELRWLIGQPRSEIPVPVEVVTRRVTCTTCPVTRDFSPYRLNIFYDQSTGIVQDVRCG